MAHNNNATNLVGQSSSSPIGSSHSVFGQQNKPLGSQTGNSMYGSTSAVVFGATQTPSPFFTNTTYSTSSSPAFDTSMLAFGASSSPAFGTSRSFGSLTPIQAFRNTGGIGQSGFGGQQGGSKVASYSATTKQAFGQSSSPFSTSSPFGSTTSTSGQIGNNDAKKSNTRKRKIGEIKKVQKRNKSDMMFSNRKISLFNKVTELSILCKAKSALIVTSPNKELYVCGYPNCDAVIQQFLTGNDTIEDGEKKKQEEIVEILRLEYEAVEDKFTEVQNLKAIIDAKNKSDSILPCWWGDSIDDMDLESLEEFKTSLQNLRLNLGSTIDEKKFMFRSNAQFN